MVPARRAAIGTKHALKIAVPRDCAAISKFYQCVKIFFFLRRVHHQSGTRAFQRAVCDGNGGDERRLGSRRKVDAPGGSQAPLRPARRANATQRPMATSQLKDVGVGRRPHPAEHRITPSSRQRP